MGYDCLGGVIPDQSSILRFRHFLEQHDLSAVILSEVNRLLSTHNLTVSSGTIVDATLLSAPVSKKNKTNSRDPAMSSTRKNNKWHFGAKGHIGVQAIGKPIVHSTDFTTAKAADISSLDQLLHGEERAIFGDAGYTKMADKKQLRAHGVYYGICDRANRRRALSGKQQRRNNKHRSLRAKVEHPFQVIKRLWGHSKMRYRGLKKNAAQFTTLCALSNLFFCKQELLAANSAT